MTSLAFLSLSMILCAGHPLANYNITWFSKAGLLLGACIRRCLGHTGLCVQFAWDLKQKWEAAACLACKVLSRDVDIFCKNFRHWCFLRVVHIWIPSSVLPCQWGHLWTHVRKPDSVLTPLLCAHVWSLFLSNSLSCFLQVTYLAPFPRTLI